MLPLFLQTNLSTTSRVGSVWYEKHELYYFHSVWMFSFYVLSSAWNRTPAMSSIYNQHSYFQGILNNVTGQCARCRYVHSVNQARFLIYIAKEHWSDHQDMHLLPDDSSQCRFYVRYNSSYAPLIMILNDTWTATAAFNVVSSNACNHVFSDTGDRCMIYDSTS